MFACILNTNPEKSGSVGCISPGVAQAWGRAGRERQQRAQKRLDAEVVQRAAEEHRRLSFLPVRLEVEARAGALDHPSGFDQRC